MSIVATADHHRFAHQSPLSMLIFPMLFVVASFSSSLISIIIPTAHFLCSSLTIRLSPPISQSIHLQHN